MIAFLSTWRDMGWSAAALLIAIVVVILVGIVLAILSYFSAEKRWLRAIRKHRRRRLAAWRFLRSTERRDVYQEFEGARR